MSLVKMIENAELRDGVLIVLDGLADDRYYGVNIELEPACTSVGGWCCEVRDGVGNGTCSHSMQKLDAVNEALDKYLDIVNDVAWKRQLLVATVQSR